MKQSKWLDTMIKKHGSKEAVREFMRQSASKSSRNSGITWLSKIAKEDPQKFREISSKGGKISKR